jgi:hypothetical protein
MDSVSSKIDLQYNIDTYKVIEKDLIDANNRKLLADIEGSLTISFNGIVYFQENYILLLEFAVFLTRWLAQIEKGIIQDFVYETMDYSEGPIIEFNQKANSVWVVKSIWAKENIVVNLRIQDIIFAANDFLVNFQKEIYKKYLISLKNFLT